MTANRIALHMVSYAGSIRLYGLSPLPILTEGNTSFKVLLTTPQSAALPPTEVFEICHLSVILSASSLIVLLLWLSGSLPNNTDSGILRVTDYTNVSMVTGVTLVSLFLPRIFNLIIILALFAISVHLVSKIPVILPRANLLKASWRSVLLVVKLS